MDLNEKSKTDSLEQKKKEQNHKDIEPERDPLKPQEEKPAEKK